MPTFSFTGKIAQFGIILLLIILVIPEVAGAQGPIPPAGESGLAEKSLRQSRPEIKEFPKKTKPPNIIVIKDSRRLADPGAGPTFFVKKIELQGNTIFDDKTLGPMVDVGEGMELTLGVLAIMAQEITAHYAANGYFLTRAYVPKQKMRADEGVVKMVVSEGKIGKFHITGNKRTRSEHYMSRLKRLRQDKVLKEQTLERVLMELNELMGVKVRSVLKPGDLPGTSDLILEVTETPPYSFSFDVDNFGSVFTGRTRMGTSGSVGNIFTLGDQFSFRGVKSDMAQESITCSYLVPIMSETTFKASYTYSEQTLGASLVALKAGGDTKMLNLELAHTMYRTRDTQIKLKAGFDSNHFQNFQLLETSGKESLEDVYVDLGGNGADSFMGRNFFDLKITRGFSEDDGNRALASRAKGSGEIYVATMNLSRFQGTGFLNSYFIMKLNGQITSSRVLSPNLFSLGGMGTVRGFPLSEQSGDQGFITSIDYILPFPGKIPLGIEKLTLNQVLSLTGFVDYGNVYVRNMQVGEKHEGITGAGGGMQINFPKIKDWLPAMSFSLSYALPLRGPVPSDRSYGLWYLNGMLSYSF